MTFTVLISAPYMLPVIERFRQRFERAGIELRLANVRERLDEEELLSLVGDVDGVICGDDRFSERVLMAALPRLRVISIWGTGIDSIDRAAAARLGVRVCNTPNAFTEPVADTTLGYMLGFVRRLDEMTGHMRAGSWEKPPLRALRETTIGIVGVGNIGSAVARRASAFGARILGNDVEPIAEEIIGQTGLQPASLEHLLREADIVTLHCDLNPSSRHLMNPATIALMRRTAILINTARGPLVDERALVAALQGGSIGGAALDVFEDEPLPLDSPLRTMKNVWLAPHNSNSSPGAWEAVHENTIRNLFQALGIATEGEQDGKSA